MILICTSNGRIGSRVLQQLCDEQIEDTICAGVRDPASAAPSIQDDIALRKVDYDSREGLEEAFAGVERVLFIPSYADTEQRAVQGENVVAAAEAAGVKQLLFISIMDTRADSPLPFAHAYGRIEACIENSSLDWVILRTSMYADNLAEQYPMWLAKGELVTCAGDGRISYISRDDITRSIVAVLKAPIADHAKTRYTLTGSEALSYEDVAAIVTKEFGTPIRVVHVERDEFADRLFKIWGVAYEGIAHVARVTPLFQAVFKEGLMSPVTSDVETLTGQKPEGVHSWIKRNR